MDLTIINIGIEKGVVIPKSIIDEYSISDKIDLLLGDECIVLKPKSQPRNNWSEAFKRMHANGDDELLIDDVFEDEEFV
jgi:antitoxin MazE